MSPKNTTDKPIPDLVTESAAELLARDLPPVKMVVGDILPAGLVLLAGDPKAGKSLLLQHLALAVATGSPAWGQYPVEQGSVLYVANEGGDRSFRDRIAAMLDGDDAPAGLHIAYQSEPLGARFEFQLEVFLTAYADTRLVVIDTFASVAPEVRGVNRYQEDYNALAGLADLAKRYPNVLFVLVHHTRKSEDGDVMRSISGSHGLSGATDGNAVLSRHTAARQCVLTIRPRNAEETEVVLTRDDNLRWSVVGADERAQLSTGRQRILEYLEGQTEAATPQQVAKALGMSSDSARTYLSEMTKVRQVEKVGRGRYLPATKEEGRAA